MKNYIIENYLIDFLSGKISFDETIKIDKEITRQIYEELLKENDK